MNLDNPAVLFSGLLIGTVGLGLFVYGKKSGNPGPLAVGLAMCVFPMFVHSLLALWGLFGACGACLVAIKRFG